MAELDRHQSSVPRDEILESVEVNQVGNGVGRCAEDRLPDGVHNMSTICELKVGMSARSDNEAFNMYNEYARYKGFSVRRGRIRYKEQSSEVRQRQFTCSREGEYTGKNTPKAQRLVTRCGCKAQALFTREGDFYVLSSFNEEHNHPLVDVEKSRFLRSHRRIDRTTADVVVTLTNAGVPTHMAVDVIAQQAGGYDVMGCTSKDVYNFVQAVREETMSAGDGQALLNHFKSKQAEDPLFFYSVQVDSMNRLTNIFWRDGSSRGDYDIFGDVVVFDTTFRTNKYNMICAPFVGVNHHWNNIFFGCAFLLDESTQSFTWLFNTFLESMGGKQPRTIFSDQDHAIGNAISDVFKESTHRLCIWHIGKNVTFHCSSLSSKEGFRQTISELVHECDDASKFEEGWKAMISKYSLEGHKWLANLYKMKERWSTAYADGVFTGKIQSTQRSESANNVFQKMTSKTMPLIRFVERYDRNMQRLAEREKHKDESNISGNLRTRFDDLSLLKHARSYYTHAILKKVEEEILSSACERTLSGYLDGAVVVYVVYRLGTEETHSVRASVGLDSVECSCKLFESCGWLCRHVFKILQHAERKDIPDRYLLCRWSKKAKIDGISCSSNPSSTSNTLNGSKIANLSRLMLKTFMVMNIAADQMDTTEIALKLLEEIKKKCEGAYMGRTSNYRDDLHRPAEGERIIRNPEKRPSKGQVRRAKSGRVKSKWEKRRKGNKKGHPPENEGTSRTVEINDGDAVEAYIPISPNANDLYASEGRWSQDFSMTSAMMDWMAILSESREQNQGSGTRTVDGH